MKGMVLAAGLGTRLRPLTDFLPKPLLPLGGVPLLVWNLLLLRKHGIKDVIINLHYRGDQIQASIGDGSYWGVRVSYSVEPQLLGTGGGIKQAESFFEGEPFIVLNGDTVVDLDLSAMLVHHRHCQALATMAIRNDVDTIKWGVVETDQQHRVLTIHGKGVKQNSCVAPIHSWMFAGIHILDPLFLQHIPPSRPSSSIDAYIAWLEHDAYVAGYVWTGYWSDVGTPERYVQVQEDVKAGKLALEW